LSSFREVKNAPNSLNKTGPLPGGHSRLTSNHPGARYFRKCAKCHALDPAAPRRSGPHFAGLFGRRAGTVPGYRYSQTLRAADFTWTDATLTDLFTRGPDIMLPGTKIPVQKIPDAEGLASLIAYMRELTGAK